MGQAMVRKTFEAMVKSLDRENLIVEHFISTESPDRMGDIVRARGMRVVGKPVVLMQHGRGPLGSEPVAKNLKLDKTASHNGVPGIMATTQFYPDDLGRRLFEKNVEGYMPSWSIGFRPKKHKIISDEAGNPTEGREFTEWELLEYSMVAVPAQPDAVTPGGRKEEAEELVFKVLEGEDRVCAKHGSELESSASCEKCLEEAAAAGDPPGKPEGEPEVKEEEVLGKVSETLEDLTALVEMTCTEVTRLADVVSELNKTIEKLELPSRAPAGGDPEPGREGEEAGNPPEGKKKAPRLVFVDAKALTDTAEKRTKELIAQLVREAVSEEVVRRYRKQILGKVD